MKMKNDYMFVLELFLCFQLLILCVRSCPSGWYSYNQIKCLKYIAVNVNYNDAENLCKASNSSIVSIHSRDEQDFILAMGRRHYTQSGVHWVWLGASRNSSESDAFYWKDGSSFNFTNWRDGCPDRRNGENCVLMTIFKDRPSHWCNFKCDSNHDHVVCQKDWTNETNSSINTITQFEFSTISYPATRRRQPPSIFGSGGRDRSPFDSTSGRLDFWGGWGRPLSASDEEDECDFGWIFKFNKCFKFVNENVTGEEAKYYCSRYSAQALTIHNEEEQTWVVDFAFYQNEAKEAVWLGATRDLNNNGEIHWRDGSPMNYTNWSPHEPDNRNSSEHCVAMNDMRKFFGRWIDAPCSLHFHLICEKQTKRPATTISVPYILSPDGTFHPSSSSSSSSSGASGSMEVDVDPFWSDNLLSESHSAGNSVTGNSSNYRTTIVLLVFLIVSMILVITGLAITVYIQRKVILERRSLGESRMNIYYSTSERDGDAVYEEP